MGERAGEQILKIALVSPGDVLAEREAVSLVVDELNRERDDLVIRLWRWETHARPGIHADGGQGIIDDLMDIGGADIVVGVFWKRFGTPTMDAQSGTEHELKLAWEAWRVEGTPEVMVYFCQRPFRPSSDELDQWKRVLAFQERMPREQLWWRYEDVTGFERAIREHLRRAIDRILRARRERAAAVRRLGRPLLRIGECDACFVDPDQAGRAVLAPAAPRIIIGVADAADVQVTGPATDAVSREHLALVPIQAGWAVRDLDSTNGTFEVDVAKQAWVRLPSDVAVPIADAIDLCLGTDFLLRIESPQPSTRGAVERTPKSEGGPLGRRRLEPVELERVAIALVEPRRRDPGSSAALLPEEVAQGLGVSVSQVERGLTDLGTMPTVRAYLRGTDLTSLADALSLAYPYLVGAALTTVPAGPMS